MIWLKKRKTLFYEAANLICWFRILAGTLLMLVTRRALGWALLYSLAFISDVWDGWCYRQVPEDQRPRHWFNRLPISMDPLADFILVGGGLLYVVDIKPLGILAVLLMATVLIIWRFVGETGSDRVFSVMMTSLTYFWFGMMVFMLVMVWRRSTVMPAWLSGIVATLAIFYACYFKVRVKSRTIRKRG